MVKRKARRVEKRKSVAADDDESEMEGEVMDLKTSAVYDSGEDDDGDSDGDSSPSDDEDLDVDSEDDDLPAHLRGLAASKLRSKQGAKGGNDSDDFNAGHDDEDSDDGDYEDEGKDSSWGRSKRAYYSGDTADLEIGQKFEEAEEEEREAKRLQKESTAKLDDGDFELSEDEQSDGDEKGEKTHRNSVKRYGGAILRDDLAAIVGAGATSYVETINVVKDLSHLSKRERLQLLLSDSPELPGLLKELLDHLDALETQVDPLADAVTTEIGASDDGVEYLHLRRQLLLGFVTNMCFYLLLKAERQPARGHPVMARLLQMSDIIVKLRFVDDALRGQMELLCDALSEGIEFTGSAQKESGRVDDKEVAEDSQEDDEGDTDTLKKAPEEMYPADEDALNEEEADFVEGLPKTFSKRSAQSSKLLDAKRKRMMNDFVFEDDDVNSSTTDQAHKPRANFPSTGKQRAAMEDGDSDGDGDSETGLFDWQFGLDGGQDEGGLYEKTVATKAEKKMKRARKYVPQPRAAGTLEAELEMELATRSAGSTSKRGVSQNIMKNRGLTPHKNKLNRNPRVKKREAFRKAVIRRKGQVRDVRTGEAASYGGETTGIRSTVVRSKKLR